MRRLFLAAGVASLAIAGAAAAKPGGGGDGPHGGGGEPHGGGGPPVFAGGGNPHGDEGRHGGGNPHESGGGPPAFAGGGGHGNGGGHGGGPPAFMEGGRGAPPAFIGGGRGHGGDFAPRFARGPREGGHRRGDGEFGPPQMRAFAEGAHGRRGGDRQQFRGFAMRGDNRFSGARQQPRAFAGGSHWHGQQHFTRQEARAFERQQSGRFERQQTLIGTGEALRHGFAGDAQQPRMNAFRADRASIANVQPSYPQSWGEVSPYQPLSYGNNVQILPVERVQQFVGLPVASASSYAALAPLPETMQYLYPDTPDYYYRWGDGYLYQVDRGDNLIAALIPLLAGGYLPGQYLPQPYMASYVPSYYGFDSLYPDYGGVCNRYYYGVIYQVDCGTGYVENVVPMYAGGYGVGQLLPSAYTYYNVPVQYRNLYYDTPDYGYWYSPGAIYQYDPRTSVITSVAALMSPGFAVGQPLPVGYEAYNIPYDYRATYYDTPDAWYRYSNGYIYQIDPVTQLVTAIVASLLT